MLIGLYHKMLTIEKKNPLKQGLKRTYITLSNDVRHIEKKNPLKQGLKPYGMTFNMQYMSIEKKNPLKQGLKPAACRGNDTRDRLKRRIH